VALVGVADGEGRSGGFEDFVGWYGSVGVDAEFWG
jgi:hypothetical protein